MKHGPFISMLAQTLGLETSSVRQVARVIREAGFLKTGPRGVNAPHLSLTDAARLILALMTGEPPSRVLSAFSELRALVPLPSLDGNSAYHNQWVDDRRLENLEDYLVFILQELQKPTENNQLMIATDEGERDYNLYMEADLTYGSVQLIAGHNKILFVRAETAEILRKAMTQNSAPNSEEKKIWPSLKPSAGIQVKRIIDESVFFPISEALSGQSIDGLGTE